MPKRKIILLVVAGLIAMITVLVARSMMHPTEEPVAQKTLPTTEILVAARDLPTGTILKEMDVKWIPWPAEAETTKLYVKGKVEVSSITGAVLREGLRADEPVIDGPRRAAARTGFPRCRAHTRHAGGICNADAERRSCRFHFSRRPR